MRKIGAVLGSALLVLAACTQDENGSEDRRSGSNAPLIVTAASLERFDACPEFLTHVRTEAKKRVTPYGLPGGFGTTTDMVGLEAGARTAADSAAAPSVTANKSFSGTNVQEANVDEPDIVKTNGEHLFSVQPDLDDPARQRLVAIELNDGRPRRAGSVLLPQAWGYQLLIAGDRVLAMSSGGYAIAGGAERMAKDMIYPPGGPGMREETIVAAIDISDASDMKLANKLVLEGTYSSARMIDGTARIVLQSHSTGPKLDGPAESTPQAEKDALERNKDKIEKSDVEEWLPSFELQDDSGKVVKEGELTSCGSTFHPTRFSGFGTTSVVTIDPDDPDPKDSASVLGSAGTVYASTQNLYVATQRWPEVRPLVIEDRPIGAPQPFQPPPNTQIHRFDIRDADNATYAASGEVKGTVLNQWSMSEHEDHLRVATTDQSFNNRGASDSESFVTTFDATGPSLEQVGQVGGLGKTERIYGVRFMGDIGYVVTFRQVDPLYVVDLADPDRPRVLGELKIPGYSAYLHPVGDGLLLGIGQDATADGGTIGTQVSLFDVRDASKPKQLDKIVFKNSNSTVEHDHHAFTWWDASDLAVLPIDSYEPNKEGQNSFALGLRVDGDELREHGRASHASRATNRFGTSIQRSIVVDDVLYTFSTKGLLASELDSFDDRGWLRFEQPRIDDGGGSSGSSGSGRVEPDSGAAEPAPDRR